LRRERHYYVHILASAARVLYIGITNHIRKRVWQHQHKTSPGFTEHFHFCRLVYYDTFTDVRVAIAREKQLKRWRREKKIWLIERVNRDWKDLSQDWFTENPRLGPSTRAEALARDDNG
jgi:putative endonuclease